MKILFGITGVLSFIALANLPYEFYVSFRWLIALAAVALGVVANRSGATVWYLLAIPAFVLWFPLFGITMDKSAWIIFNVLAGIGFIAAANSKQLLESPTPPPAGRTIDQARTFSDEDAMESQKPSQDAPSDLLTRALAGEAAAIWEITDSLFDEERFDESLEWANRGIAQGVPGAHFQAGLIFHKRNIHDSAELHYRKSIALGPTGEAWHNLGMIHRGKGASEEAEHAFQAASALGNPGSAFCLGHLQLALGETAKAIEWLGKSWEQGDVNGLALLGAALTDSGQVDEGIRYWELGVEQKVKNCARRLSVYYGGIQEYGLGLEAASAGAEFVEPGDKPIFWDEMASHLHELKRDDEALVFAKKAWEADYLDAAAVLSFIYDAMDKPEEAENILLEAWGLGYARADTFLGFHYQEREGLLDLADVHFRAACELGGASEMNDYGNFLKRSSRMDEAFEWLWKSYNAGELSAALSLAEATDAYFTNTGKLRSTEQFIAVLDALREASDKGLRQADAVLIDFGRGSITSGG